MYSDQTKAARVRRHALRFPDRTKARKAVSRAVRRGKLLPARLLPCYDCQGPAKQYDHYLGYEPDHKLDVQPVCLPCHYKRVRRIPHVGPFYRTCSICGESKRVHQYSRAQGLFCGQHRPSNLPSLAGQPVYAAWTPQQ